MSKRGYVSNRFPELVLGERVRFENGVFETDDPAVIALIESNEWFGVHIHPRETPEEIAAADDRRTSPRAHVGGIGSLSRKK